MGKTIVVTGSSSGLGAKISEVLLWSGHNVVGYDIKNGYNVERPDMDFLEDRIGAVDGLINCAGINDNKWFADVNARDLEHIMSVNAFSMVYMTQALLPKLQASAGFVINIVSNAASIPMTSSLAYNASKAAALMITKQMAHELTKTHGITVFSVSPNKLEGTEMSKAIEENVVKTRGWTKSYAAEYQRKALMHGLETPPGTVADIISNLINTGAWKYMSGVDVPVGK